MVEPPYGIICNRLKAGCVIPFLGAGASFVGRPPDAKWDAAAPSFLPSGLELARVLADEAEFPAKDAHDRDDLARFRRTTWTSPDAARCASDCAKCSTSDIGAGPPA